MTNQNYKVAYGATFSAEAEIRNTFPVPDYSDIGDMFAGLGKTARQKKITAIRRRVMRLAWAGYKLSKSLSPETNQTFSEALKRAWKVVKGE